MTAVFALTVLLQLAGPQPTAAAHERLLRADPAPGAIVAGPVTVIRLTFLDAISPGFAAATLAVDDGPASPINLAVDGATLTVIPPDPAPATRQRWTIVYRVVSSDGHPVVDQLTFTVTPAGGPGASGDHPAAPARALPPSAAVPAAEPLSRWPVAVAPLLVLTVGVAVRARRRGPAAPGDRRGEL